MSGAPFGLLLLALTVLPTSTAHQDIGALLASQPDVSQRWRSHVIASPFGSVKAAGFNFPRPLGTNIPEMRPYRVASLGFVATDEDRSPMPYGEMAVVSPDAKPIDYPTVNRRLKGDLLISRAPNPIEPRPQAAPGRVRTVSFPRPEALVEWAEPSEPSDGSIPGDVMPMAPFDPADAEAEDDRMSRLYFGVEPHGDVGPILPWPADDEAEAANADPDLKRSAVTPPETLISRDPLPSEVGETLAPKGLVAPPPRKTPAQRLGLDGKQRAKAETCLANAVYFEARSEPKRGQIAVAQVVMNRVFSGFYPDDVCATVYQNAHRRLSCQFTFACDGIRDVVSEPELYGQARQIARDTLDGKIWLPEIGKSTHYHANYVHPWWARSMRKLSTIGLHKIYRPRNWGDGADAPAWGPGFSPDGVAAKL